MSYVSFFNTLLGIGAMIYGKMSKHTKKSINSVYEAKKESV